VPSRVVEISGLGVERISGSGYKSVCLNLPLIELICDTDSCGGKRLFESTDEIRLEHGKVNSFFVYYVCRNCKKFFKTYSIHALLKPGGLSGEIYKYGEHPSFGPPVPAKVISLVGPERDYFLKGRRSESQGLGIAAFAYYRRVIENQKNRLFDEIIRVSAKVGADPEILADLEKAN
jgi:hypothetical protein